MEKFETVIIISNKITDEAKDKTLEKIKQYISDNGNIGEIQDLGLRILAYEIQKYTHGFYFIIEFEFKQKNIHSLESLYKKTDEILKFIIIKKQN